MKHILLLFVAFSSFLLSCATTYKEGAYEKPVNTPKSDNVRKVGFKGNLTDDYWIYYYTLLKAAETTVNNGYEFFVAYESNFNSDADSVSLYGGNSLGSSTPHPIKDNYYEMQIYMFKDLSEIPNGTIYHNAGDILLYRDTKDTPPPRKFFDFEFKDYLKATILLIYAVLIMATRDSPGGF